MSKRLSMSDVLVEVRPGVWKLSEKSKSLQMWIEAEYPEGVNEDEDWYGVGVEYFRPHSRKPSMLGIVNVPASLNVEEVENRLKELAREEYGKDVGVWSSLHLWDDGFSS